MKKGPLAEKQVVEFLIANGLKAAERRVQGGAKDRGDVAGIPGVVIEVKNQAKMTLAEWVDEALTEGENEYDAQRRKGSVVSMVWHKRRGRSSPGHWYVTMSGWDALLLLYAWDRWEKEQAK